ncbi:MAG: secondary thiamine-phosphate synthase enzyme YjbQ [Minwuia sp.]|nr:secondary thiamine-phosphate synthase enzyme YjbQ [Minwuia sp.]
MRQAQTTLTIATPGRGLHDITRQVADWCTGTGLQVGLLTIFIRHTSASLTIQENADPDVLHDLETFMARLVSDDTSLYRHTAEGADDMPAHIRSALTATSIAVPVALGLPLFGTWQGLYLWEHRTRAHRRQVILHMIGE